ncbi:MAG TPA: 4'-phosphopantetheinyl transferase superfamily protein [Bacteroidia bacterium]|nr:4'-phosphopantetheinyl transferase superfamily protein [Bacteroidia bacterium]
MPLLYDKQISEQSRICIWEINESPEELLQMGRITMDELEQAGKKTLKRQLEWLTTRFLLKQMLSADEQIELFYDEYGKPHLKGHKEHISISHTKQFVAVISHNFKRVGIDIEIVTPRIEKISHRFLSRKELEWTKENYSLEKLFIVWGAKESAFKIYSAGGIEFKEMLEVNPFNYAVKGATLITLDKNNVTCAYPVWWEHLGRIMLVYAMEN